MGESISIPKGQKARVLHYLDIFGSITPLDALREFGILRLAAVIFELRKEYIIETRMEESTNRFDEPVQYARYTLICAKETRDD